MFGGWLRIKKKQRSERAMRAGKKAPNADHHHTGSLVIAGELDWVVLAADL